MCCSDPQDEDHKGAYEEESRLDKGAEYRPDPSSVFRTSQHSESKACSICGESCSCEFTMPCRGQKVAVRSWSGYGR